MNKSGHLCIRVDATTAIGSGHVMRCLALAQEARKPMFFLKPADGALGAHSNAVHEAYKDFEKVAKRIAANAGIKPPS